MHPASHSHCRTAALSVAINCALGFAALPCVAADEPQAARKATELDTIQVRAEKVRASADALGNRLLLDTPFSITDVDAADIQERQVNSLTQLLINDPSVSGNVGAYNSGWYTTVQVRGLSLGRGDSLKINGTPLYTFGAEWPVESMEQVQLLKGASGFMYGFGAPGGILNYVTKKPTASPLLDLNLGVREGGVYSAHLDSGGHLGADGRLGYRFNALHEQGDAYNGAEVERSLVSLGLDAQLSDTLTWTADLLYQNRELGNEPIMLTFQSYADTALPARLDPKRDRPHRDNFFNTEMQALITGLQWQINDAWQARLDLGYNKFRSAIGKNWGYLVNRLGDVRLYNYGQANLAENYQAQALLEGKLHTGPISHHIVAGTSWQRSDSGWASNSLWASAGTYNIYLPDDIPNYSFAHSRETYRGTRIDQTAIFASDTVAFNEQWSLLAGLRHTRYAQDSWNYLGVHTSRYRKPSTTPTVALLFKPRPDQTLYLSYVQALEQGGTVGATYENRNEVLPPLESSQYELGYKLEKPRWALETALFRIERGAEYVRADNYYVQDGEIRYQGLDISASVQVLAGWRVGAGATWLDAEYLRTTPSIVGNRPTNAPEFQATLNTAYDVAALPGLSLHAQAKRYGGVMFNTANSLELPGFTLVDAGASYRTQWGATPVTLRAQITNLTDRHYWTNDGNGYGQPRTWGLSSQFQF